MNEYELTVVDSITAEYYHLTNSEKKVADFILGNKDRVQYMSISELADECGVAEATVSRFCRRLKLKSYNDFKLSMAKAAAGATQDTVAEPVGSELARSLLNTNIAALTQTLSLLDQKDVDHAVRLLCSARRVVCMGLGGSMLIANEACHVFSTATAKFTAIPDNHTQASAAALMGPEDVILYFSYSGSTRDIQKLIRLARSRGAKVVLVTRFIKSPGAKLADVVLCCGSDEGPLQLGSVAAKFAQLFVIDVLFHEYCQYCPDSYENRMLIANALADEHL